MYNITPMKEQELLHHLSRFAESCARALFDLCGFQFLAGVPVKSTSEEVTLKELTIFTNFTGTVQGTYAITIPQNLASHLLDLNPEKADLDDYSAGLFEEILNVAVGHSIEELKEQFGFLTFNPPSIVLGDIRFPSYRNCTVDLISDMGNFSTYFSINMANLEITDKLLSTMQNLRKQQSINFSDSLTGINNRAYFEYFKKKLFGKRRPLSFAIFDVDKFKDINDGYGHSTGDLALKHIADNIKSSVRDSDIAIRFGGDEFVIILEDSPLVGARRLLERISIKLKENPLFINENESLIITLSAGITEYNKGEPFESMFERADEMLYKAKENGRDQICG